MPFSKESQLVVCVVGIYVFYLLFGIVQENLSTHEYGPNKEKFAFTSFLLATQSVGNALCAWIVILVTGLPKDKTPFTKYAFVSAASIGAMFCSNKAITSVDYPTMVLAKSCKPIPVMMMGLIAFKKKYSTTKYICVTIVTLGIMLFMNPSSSTHKPGGTVTTWVGVALLVGSLALDGLTGPFQDDLIREYKPSSPHLMMYSNIWASLFMFTVVLAIGDLIPAIDFMMRFPAVITQVALFSILSAFGQNFIYYTIYEFGALTCTTVTTTRKFATILASVVYFGHSLSRIQWAAVVMVFYGLGYDILHSSRNHRRQAAHRA